MVVPPPSPDAIIATSAVLSALCISVTALRFYARHMQRSRLLMDDWLSLVALILLLGLTASQIAGAATQVLGFPTPPHDPANPKALSRKEVITAQYQWITFMFQTLALGTTKLSFVFFIRRIFVVNKHNKYAIATTSCIVLISVWTIAFFFGFLFNCGSHFSAYWSADVFKYCTKGQTFENGWSLSDVLIDAIIILMPIPMIWRLQMSSRRKLAITGVFGFGLLAVAASILRLAIFYQAKAVAFKQDIDNDLLITTVTFWSMVEAALAAVAINLPVLHSLFRKASIDRFLDSHSRLASLLLGSRGSRSGGSSSKLAHSPSPQRGPTMATTSTAPNLTLPPTSVESFAMKEDLPRDEFRAQAVPPGEIGVATVMTQSKNRLGR